MKRHQLWHSFFKPILRHYIDHAGKGAAAYMARQIGQPNSQVHRMQCPVCEHNQVPTRKHWQAVTEFLSAYAHSPFSILPRELLPYTSHRNGSPLARRKRRLKQFAILAKPSRFPQTLNFIYSDPDLCNLIN